MTFRNRHLVDRLAHKIPILLFILPMRAKREKDRKKKQMVNMGTERKREKHTHTKKVENRRMLGGPYDNSMFPYFEQRERLLVLFNNYVGIHQVLTCRVLSALQDAKVMSPFSFTTRIRSGRIAKIRDSLKTNKQKPCGKKTSLQKKREGGTGVFICIRSWLKLRYG